MTNYDFLAQLLQSPTGKRMLARVSPIYDYSAFMKKFYQSVGEEFDELRKFFETLREQHFTTQVTWGIEYLEHKYSIVPDKSLTLEERRERLKIRTSHKYPLNPAILEKYALDNFDLETFLDESETGYINIYLETFKKKEFSFVKWLLLERPAHLILKCKVDTQIAESNIYFGIADFIGGTTSITYAPPDTSSHFELSAGIQTFINGNIGVGIAVDNHEDTANLFAGVHTYIRGTISVGIARPDNETLAICAGVTSFVHGSISVGEFVAEKDLLTNSEGESTSGIIRADLITKDDHIIF